MGQTSGSGVGLHQSKEIAVLCRMRDAMALQLAGKNASAAPAETSNLISEFLGRARTPRWLGDPYGVDGEGAVLMGPERVSLPNIAAKSRRDDMSQTRQPLNIVRRLVDACL